MKNDFCLAVLLVSAAGLPTLAFSQETTPAVPGTPEIPAAVQFQAAASMPTLTDPSRRDTFSVTLTDAQVRTEFELTCSAGYTTFLVVRSDKACAVSGSGSSEHASAEHGR